MTNTGTFAPLLNKRDYNENEKIVLEYFFTNIDKNIYCAKNTLSYQLWAFLVGQYSRSDLSMRDRFLQLFQDNDKALEKGLISKEEHISLDDLAQDIKNSKSIKLDYFEQRSSDFLKKWGVDFGHNSLKDADRIRFAIEGVSQVFTKVIESPFPALGDFQEKSTRYLHFGKESLIIPQDLLDSNYASDIKQISNDLMETYLKSFPIVRKALEDNQIVKREEFTSDRSYENTLNAKIFDIVRYLLPSNVSTSLGASFSTRTLESHLTYMLSHPLLEVRTIAETMHTEALKLSPGLLKHVGVSEYELKKRQNLDRYTKELFRTIFEKEDNIEFFKGIDDKDRVDLVFEGDLDNQICASLLFENSRSKGLSYNECLDIVLEMDKNEKEYIMKLALGDRGSHDRMPRALQHSSVMFEFLIDFGAYRDIQRHRASSQLWQGATAISGYDYPEYINLPGMEEFKDMYDDVMAKATLLANDIVKENTYLSEYACALGHLVRTTFEMNPGQLAYVIEQRTTPWGHHSYRRLFIEVYNQLKEIAPIYAKYIRVGKVEEESSRKIQEEKSEVKRQKLGI
ncbi:MAG: FAD-dependent thymidylate synthase [Candidatus Gracilibacteria bacterium]|nr:FAD-dependent thymidylate synthase [Candidatus Gracilibacteria bacterium]